MRSDRPRKFSLVAEATHPHVYSIAAHRGFADALVAGVVPRYRDPDLGLARLTLLLPSSRSVRNVTEAFIRHLTDEGAQGTLLPRMAAVGDLDLDEALGPLIDPLGATEISPAIDPTRRWLMLAEIIAREFGDDAPRGPALYRLARDMARVMDRLLVENIAPEALRGDAVLDLLGDLAGHWQDSLRRFAIVQAHWLSWLESEGRIEAAERRNRLFAHAARRWKTDPPTGPVVAAGVTSSAPALARLLRVIADLPDGAVILPDLDLTMDEKVWTELGRAGQAPSPGDPPFARGDAVTHPQYHLKLLLNRMGVGRGEVRPWHRRGAGAARPERSHAISALFLPPEASRGWIDLAAEKRRLAGVRVLEAATSEEEAQAIALAIREALEEPQKRVALVTPDRPLARRVVQHLRRWNIEADDSAGRPLSQTAAGRLFLLMAEAISEGGAPVPMIGLLGHPLVRGGNPQARREWLARLRRFELALRGPRPAAGLQALETVAANSGTQDWWAEAARIIAPLFTDGDPAPLAELLDRLASVGEDLCGEVLWSREDGRALSTFVDDVRLQARAVQTTVDQRDLHAILADAMEAIAVRPPYGGHPRIAIYGLLESRMTRADLVICAGLNEGRWPGRPAVDPLLAPTVLRALGVPGVDFRIGLAAHDLAAAMGASQVLLTRAARDTEGPTIPSRFLLRAKALLGELLPRHQETALVRLARAVDDEEPAPPYARPVPIPAPDDRRVRISVTALDRLRSDPYQFYASTILRLQEIDTLDAEPTPAWQGEVVHDILQKWHERGGALFAVAQRELQRMDHHPLTRALWEPRLLRALEWVENTIAETPERKPVLFEKWGSFQRKGVDIFGRIDRLDRLGTGGLAVVDYKTGRPPSKAQVERGYALQLGTLGLMVEAGGFTEHGIAGRAELFEYWSLGKDYKGRSDTGFGYIEAPVKTGAARTGIAPEEFLPRAADFLDDALERWILGVEPFTARLNPDAAGYDTYDQLMRLDEWLGLEERA